MASRVGLLGRLARRIERVFEGGGEAGGVDRVRRPPPSRPLPPPPSPPPDRTAILSSYKACRKP